MTEWSDGPGLVALPSGARVRGRRLADDLPPADFALVLGPGPAPAWPHLRVRWPDFWVPLNRADAQDALREAHRRALDGQRVEVTCRGGVGRTGTALAALAVLGGLPPGEAVRWVRRAYHPRAVETPVAAVVAAPDALTCRHPVRGNTPEPGAVRLSVQLHRG